MPGDFDSRFGSFHVSHWGGTDTQLAALTRRAMLALLRDCRRHPFAEAVWRRARAMDPASLRADDGLRRLLRHLRLRLDRLAGQDRRRQNLGDAALASSLRLQPGESRDVHFVLGWHFPVHYSQLGPDLGHRYEAWFADAEAVARHLVAGRKAQRGATVGFADTLFDTNLLPELPDAWAGQLTTIPKCTWWTRDGSFGVW